MHQAIIYNLENVKCSRDILLAILKTQGTPPFILRLIKDLHEVTSSRVRTASGDVSDSFPTSSVLRQACILASALFCCTVDWILRRYVSALEVTIGSNTFTDLNYADDVVLFDDCAANWSSLLELFDEAAEAMGMHMSWAKTKILNVSPGTTPLQSSSTNTT